MQFKINKPSDIVFEWIPYNQFIDIKKIGRGGFAEVYSAIWEDGPLDYNSSKNEYTRSQNKKKVTLEYYFYNSTNEFISNIIIYKV